MTMSSSRKMLTTSSSEYLSSVSSGISSSTDRTSALIAEAAASGLPVPLPPTRVGGGVGLVAPPPSRGPRSPSPLLSSRGMSAVVPGSAASPVLGCVSGKDLPKHIKSDGPSREFSMLTYKEQRLYVAKKTTRAGHSERNRQKNRYSNVVPYDDTRVTLTTRPGEDPANDYINASYVDGEADGTERAYIATQGPLPHTFGDFWRMVWETGCRVVVMLGKEREKDKVKVDRYWPTQVGEVVQYGRCQVTLADVHVKEDSSITLRRLEVSGPSSNGETRLVYHYQYAGWPDHGAPTTTKHIRELIQMLYKHLGASAQVQDLRKLLPRPIVVHCFTTEHQVLTDAGFLFLRDIRERLRSGARPLRVAAYDSETRRLVYVPFQLVVNSARPRQRMVEVSHVASGVSVVVTPGHDMFVRGGRFTKDADVVEWDDQGERGRGRPTHAKLRAKKLLCTEDAVPERAFGMLTLAECGVFQGHSPSRTPPLFMQLGLDVECPRAVAAFLGLYGCWIGKGGASSVGRGRVARIGNLSEDQGLWVEEQLAMLGMRCAWEGDGTRRAVDFGDERSQKLFFDEGRKAGGLGNWVWELSTELSRAVLRGLEVACGSCSEGARSSLILSGTCLRDDVVRLCLHSGRTVSFRGTKGAWEVLFASSGEQAAPVIRTKQDVKTLEYDGETWCVTVPQGLIVARRASVDQDGVVDQASTPLIVGNCSAGIGRTGAFCAVHLTIERMRERWDRREPLEFNLFQTVLRLRKARAGMVQQLEQYNFCYETILDEALEIGLIQGSPRFRVYSSGLSRGFNNPLSRSANLWPTVQPALSPTKSGGQLSQSHPPPTSPVAVPPLRRTAMASMYSEQETSEAAFMDDGFTDRLERSHSFDENTFRECLFDEYESDASDMDCSQDSCAVGQGPEHSCSCSCSSRSSSDMSTAGQSSSDSDRMSDGAKKRRGGHAPQDDANTGGDTDVEDEDGFVIIGQAKRKQQFAQPQAPRPRHRRHKGSVSPGQQDPDDHGGTRTEHGHGAEHRHNHHHHHHHHHRHAHHGQHKHGHQQQPAVPGRELVRTPPNVPGQVRKRSNSGGTAEQLVGRGGVLQRRPSRSQLMVPVPQQQQQQLLQTKVRSNSSTLFMTVPRPQPDLFTTNPNSLSRTLTLPPSSAAFGAHAVSQTSSPKLHCSPFPLGPFTSMPMLPPVLSPPQPSSPQFPPQFSSQQQAAPHCETFSFAVPSAPSHPQQPRVSPPPNSLKLQTSPPSPTRPAGGSHQRHHQ